MDAFTMASTSSLIKKLKETYPQFQFEESTDYLWSPSKQTVYYVSSDKSNEYLVHELAHALLGHSSYNYDIELLPMERDAWDKAVELAPDLDINIQEETVESNLDSYRSWMHARSTCPSCGATGVQTKKRLYKCPACTKSWRVNDARICGLKRYLVKE
jgi:hypothetical protein